MLSMKEVGGMKEGMNVGIITGMTEGTNEGMIENMTADRIPGGDKALALGGWMVEMAKREDSDYRLVQKLRIGCISLRH